MSSNSATLHRLIARVWLIQAIYDVFTGIWGLVDIRSFQKVTGPKTDTWLVKTVSVLVIVIGATIGAAGRRDKVTPEIVALAVGTNAGLTAIDVYYVTRRRISPVYLLDAIAELALIAGWWLAIRTTILRLDNWTADPASSAKTSPPAR
jgi:hypothetical protein